MIKLAGWITGVFFVIVFGVTGAHAQATRTWISGVGDDANPCSRTAPCKTFAGAISKTAAGGEIDVLDPGGFGAVTITKAITLDGSGGSTAGVLVSGTNGIVVSAGAGDVVILRNLDINGISGTGSGGLSGILFNSGKALFVENSVIYGFTQYGINFAPAASSTLSVEKTLIRQAASGGLLVKPGPSGHASVTVSGSRFEQNQAGVRAEDNSEVTISNSIAGNNVGNGFAGVSTANPVSINLEGCVSTDNGYSGIFASGPGTTFHISNTTLTHNALGISLSGGHVVSFGNNRISGNTTDGAPTSTITQQ